MDVLASARRGIVDVCHRLYDKGLIAGPDGNVSVRVGADRVLVTPGGMRKADVLAADLVEVTLAGERVGGERGPSSELAVHLRIYAARGDVRAVVHAHPPVATGFAVAGEGFPPSVLPELICQVGEVPLVPYAAPGTAELAARLDPYLAVHDAFLLANHGAVTTGPTLDVAHQRMESLEHAARIILAARLLGRVNTLTPAQAAELLAGRTPGGSGWVDR
ncbi:MAG TPA: class II aldolase/adducin family protein [Gemmatimonadaceae bacterium]|nr:class II aldolase/adducin family protein [Gemmatimonadaceae bacterium]